jgi:predicted dehydrogenase
MPLRIGLIGCGNISDIYLTNAAAFRDFEFFAVSDINPDAARRQSEKYGPRVLSVDQLLASPDIDAVLNLTIPSVHAEISLAAIAAGKHVYSEKPLAASLADGRRLVAAAADNNLRVGCAPDTILGAGVQTARALIDQGVIGKPLTGLAAVLGRGMEAWHPNPTFFFKPGGGPVLDMGPYYIATLVTLLGPVEKVVAVGQIGFDERIVTTPGSPIVGSAIKVEVLTSVQAFLTFVNGAQVAFLASWDVWRHGLPPIELHGESGSLRVPDPNFFDGSVALASGPQDWRETPTGDRAFGRANWPTKAPDRANWRGVGLADMARAIIDNRPHRADGRLALHTLAVLEGVLQAAVSGKSIVIADRCERPASLTEEEAKDLLA